MLHWRVQASGFRRVRNRRVGASNRASDPLGAGLYVFSGVRWLSPDDPCEAQHLSDGLARLVGTFPHLGGAIQLERLKSILRRNRCEWDQSPGTQSRRRGRRTLRQCGVAVHAESGGASCPCPCERIGADHSSFGITHPTPADCQATASILQDWLLPGVGGLCLSAAAAEPQYRPSAGPANQAIHGFQAPPQARHRCPARPFALAPAPSSPSARPLTPTIFAVACSAAHTPVQSPCHCRHGSEHAPAETEAACGEGGADWPAARWSCEEAGGWLLAGPLEAEGAGEPGGCWAGGRAWSVVLLDLPPAGDPGAAWATFDTLLPHILNLA